MERFSRSWALAKQSWQVLRQTPSLIVFPIISGIVTVILSISFFVPVYLATGGKELDQINPAIGYPVMFAFYLVSYFIVIFFNSGLVASAYDSLSGKPTSFGEGMNHAIARLPAILGWTLIAATVGMILQLIAERFGIVGRIVVSLIGLAWNVATFLVVPVLVVERGSPVEALKKSTGLLKKTWGENLIGQAGLGYAMLALSFAPVLPIIGLFMIDPIAGVIGIGVGVIYWLVLAAIGAAMQGVFQTALYVYAETGVVAGGFSQDNISNAFSVKEKKGRFGF